MTTFNADRAETQRENLEILSASSACAALIVVEVETADLRADRGV